MQAHDIHTFFEDIYHRICEYADANDLWQQYACDLKQQFEQEDHSLDDALALTHEALRLIQIHVAGLANSHAFADALDQIGASLWSEFQAPPVTYAQQDKLAAMLYHDDAVVQDKVMLNLGDQARYIGVRLVEMHMDNDIPFAITFAEPNFGALLLNHADGDGITALAEAKNRAWEDVTKTIACRPETPRTRLIDYSEDNAAAMAAQTAAIGRKISSGAINFCLTAIPTEADAELDGFAYHDYIHLFFELCDQPWHNIGQAHQQALIPRLDAGRHIHITNDDGTDIELELVDHDGTSFTFCNSLVQRNIPGSEVFSAPRRDSVNGKVVARGAFSPREGEIVKNLTMHFRDGYLCDFEAEEGASHFQRFLDRYPGNRYIGELGIGTNPHLKRHVLNGLLVEKISGSFHLALGKCYTMNEYDGRVVHVDNGNSDTLDHWDITTMLYGTGGRIELDGETLMEDGLFTGQELAVLNKGWAAIPAEERPDHWRDYQGPEHGLGAPVTDVLHTQTG